MDGVGIEVEVGVEVEVGGVGVGVGLGLTCSRVYYFHGWVGWLRRLCGGLVAEAMWWVGGVEKSRIELTSAKLG